jgi:hypothetical protein
VALHTKGDGGSMIYQHSGLRFYCSTWVPWSGTSILLLKYGWHITSKTNQNTFLSLLSKSKPIYLENTRNFHFLSLQLIRVTDGTTLWQSKRPSEVYKSPVAELWSAVRYSTPYTRTSCNSVEYLYVQERRPLGRLSVDRRIILE